MNEQIIEFLTELRSHNNREWFQDNKNRYDALRKGFIDEVQDLIGRISLFDPEVAGLEAKDCLFRIYRDIVSLRIRLLINVISPLTSPKVVVPANGVVIISIWSREVACFPEVYGARHLRY